MKTRTWIWCLKTEWGGDGEEREDQPCSVCSQLRGVCPPGVFDPIGALRCQPTVLDLHYDLWQLSSQDNLEEAIRLAAFLAYLCCTWMPQGGELSTSTRSSTRMKDTAGPIIFFSGKKKIIFYHHIPYWTSWSWTYLSIFIQPQLAWAWPPCLREQSGRSKKWTKTDKLEKKKAIYLSVVWLTFGAWVEIKMEKGNTKTFTNELYEQSLC